jgi:hypothetical protein
MTKKKSTGRNTDDFNPSKGVLVPTRVNIFHDHGGDARRLSTRQLSSTTNRKNYAQRTGKEFIEPSMPKFKLPDPYDD